MARRRFFVDAVRQSHAVLEGEDARHLRQVLRAEVGQQYEICDNQAVYLAEIEGFRKDEVLFRAIEELPVAVSPGRFTLLLALIKFDRFEWAIEKATELGVETIVPIETARSEKGLERAALKRLERWRKIARESSQQARRSRLPEIREPAAFAAAIRDASPHRYFLDEEPGVRPLAAALPSSRSASDAVSLLVGPEGGWTDAERTAALDAGWRGVSLGPLVLRAETAAMAGLAVLANAWLAGNLVDPAVEPPLS
ncbi:MAG: RsmE family RNA methyltransferase [Bryobacteraceae bacterium]